MSQNSAEITGRSLAGRFATGAFWSLIGTIGSRVSLFLVAVITARLLGQVGFGELGMIQSTIGLLGTFVGLGASMTATKFVSEFKYSDPERSGRIISLTYIVSWLTGLIASASCYFAAPYLALKSINAPHLAPEIRLASFFLLMSAGFGPQGGILTGLQAFRSIALITICQSLFTLTITAVLTWAAGLRGFIYAIILSCLFGGILSSIILSRQYKKFQIHLNFIKAFEERKAIWSFSIPAFLENIFFTPIIWIGNAILVNQPNGYMQLGLFNAAMQFQWLITSVNSILSQVSLPMLAEIYGSKEHGLFARTFNLNLNFNWLVGISGGFLAIAASPFLIKVFGQKFSDASQLIPLVICYTVINLASGIAWQSFYSSGYLWHSLLSNIIWCTVFLIVAKIFIPAYGAFGLAYTYILARILFLILQLCLIKKLFNTNIFSDLYLASLFCVLLFICSLFSYYFMGNIYFHVSLIIFSLGTLYFTIVVHLPIVKSLYFFTKSITK